jgi:hypothetical protein
LKAISKDLPTDAFWFIVHPATFLANPPNMQARWNRSLRFFGFVPIGEKHYEAQSKVFSEENKENGISLQ